MPPADAAIAANGVLAVTQPNMCGIGGDIFVLYYEAATRTVHFLNGAGRSGSRASLEELRRRGLPGLPVVGAPTVSVPGCVRGWAMLHERFGTRPLTELLTPAIRCAERGFPVSSLTSQAIEEFAAERIGYEDACGARPIGGLLVAARRRGLGIATVDLRNSGDTEGDRERVVGYGAWVLR